MQIDGLNLDLRERNAWEAFDLGVALARTTGMRLFLPYSVNFIGLALLLHLAAWGRPMLALAILVWLKPVAERVALAVLSQAIFGAAPSARATLASLGRIPRTGLLMSLTLGRFDLARSFHLPVRQLEGQKGRAWRERVRLLDKKLRGHAIWLTVAISNFVVVLVYGMNGLLGMLLPEGLHAGLDWSLLFDHTEETLTNQYLFSAWFVLAECVLEPIYVAAGFALYLSRRTALEGWDLEVAFKRMAARIEEQRRAMPGAGAPAVLMALGLIVTALVTAALPQPAWAQDEAPDEITQAEQSKQAEPAAKPASAEKKAIGQVLAAPEFNEFADEKVWRYRGPKSQMRGPDFGVGWFNFIRFLGELMRGVFWVAAVLLLGWLLSLLARHFGWFKGAFKMRRARPDVLFGLDLRPESLPDDLAAAARALLAAGDVRGALALLYRASLSVLVHERDVEIRDSDTEGDCVRRVEKLGVPALADYFRSLVAAWGQIAYAGLTPPAAQIRALIDAWPRHFVPAEPAAAGDAPMAGLAA
jgi:hypothetical protein